MKGATMTLTDFLLARIAEDEAAIRDGMVGIIALSLATRILAECEAKRRIVQFFVEYEDAGPETPNIHGILIAGGVVLPALALPYADHPDYPDYPDYLPGQPL